MEKLNQIGGEHKATFCWVPSHVRILDNKKVDKFARGENFPGPLLGPETFCRVEPIVKKGMLKERKDKERQRVFSVQLHWRQTILL